MTAVVTGASGHIGANLVRELLRRGEHVRVLVHATTEPLDGLDVEVRRGDVLDPDSLRRAFAGSDVVYHLAAVVSIVGDPHGTVRAVNVQGAEHAARAALECGVRRFVLCSSIHAFGVPPGGGTLDETTPLVSDDPRVHRSYDRSKAEGDRRVAAVAEHGLDTVVVHPTSVIGPNDFEPSRMGRFFLKLYERSLPAVVRGSFDFVDVRDVAAGLVAAARSGRSGERYLLSGHHHTIRSLAATAETVTGVRAPRWAVPIGIARLGVPAARVLARVAGTDPLFTTEAIEILRSGTRVDGSRAARDLGHTPRPTQDTVRDTYRWFAAAGRIRPDAVLQDRPAAGGGTR